MLTTLLESRSHQPRDGRGTAASVMVHAAIIFAAVYATAAATPARDKPVNPPAIHWLPIPQPRSATSTPRPDRTRTSSVTVPTPRPIVVPIAVPTSLPPLQLPAPTVPPTEFPRDTATTISAPDQVTPGVPSGGARGAYERSEMEVAVIGNTVPEYPSALRARNIEGKVFAEFVVNDLGRAEAGSLRLLSPANEGFVESIRRALPQMRFRPATIGGHAVAQLVQQQFVFKLDR